jgi:hypothetical protein
MLQNPKDKVHHLEVKEDLVEDNKNYLNKKNKKIKVLLFIIIVIIFSCKSKNNDLISNNLKLNTIDFTKEYSINDIIFRTKMNVVIEREKRIIKQKGINYYN